VAKNRALSVYYNVIEKILLAHIYQLIKVEGEGDDTAKFENGNNDKELMYVHEGDKREDSSKAPRESEDEDGDNDKYNDKDIEGDDEEDNNKIDDGEYKEDNEYTSI